MNRWRIIRLAALMLVIFGAGGFSGWWLAAHRVPPEPGAAAARPRGGPTKERLLNELNTELKLTPQQHQSIDTLLNDWDKESNAILQQRLRARMALFQKYSPLIRTNLTPEQQTIYDRKTQEAERRRRMMERRAQ